MQLTPPPILATSRELVMKDFGQLRMQPWLRDRRCRDRIFELALPPLELFELSN